MITLDEAIEHAEQVAQGCEGECSDDHRQLAEWLKELADEQRKVLILMAEVNSLRTQNIKLRALVADMWHDGMCDCDEYGACAKCEYGYLDRMRELGIEVK